MSCLYHFCICSFMLLLVGCGLSKRMELQSKLIPSYNPTNTYCVSKVPAHIHRVALLPIYNSDQEGIILDPLNESFYIELIQTQLFEVIHINRNELMDLWGKAQLSSTGSFPPDFIIKIKSMTQADAVMLLDLTQFRPYQPICMGIRARLVSLDENTLVWAFESIFDAGDPRVAMGAKRYQERYQSQTYPLNQPISVLQSPIRFSRYVAFTTFQNLLRIQPVNDPEKTVKQP